MTDSTDFDSLGIVLGGRRIADPWDRLRRACGLAWSGGPPETHAYRFYDLVTPPDPDRVDAVDVLAAGVIHPSLSPTDLAFFHDETEILAAWLADTPADVRLAEADEATIDHVAALATWDGPVSLGLLTTVLHRLRPLLVPIVDQHLVDWYRRYTGEGDVVTAWPILLQGLRYDLRDPATAISLAMMGVGLENELGHAPSTLRRVDLIVRMDQPDGGDARR